MRKIKRTIRIFEMCEEVYENNDKVGANSQSGHTNCEKEMIKINNQLTKHRK